MNIISAVLPWEQYSIFLTSIPCINVPTEVLDKYEGEEEEEAVWERPAGRAVVRTVRTLIGAADFTHGQDVETGRVEGSYVESLRPEGDLSR